jgi:hypothetical protein
MSFMLLREFPPMNAHSICRDVTSIPKGALSLRIHLGEILLPPWGYLLKAKHYHISRHKLFEWALFPRVKWNYLDHPYHYKLF